MISRRAAADRIHRFSIPFTPEQYSAIRTAATVDGEPNVGRYVRSLLVGHAQALADEYRAKKEEEKS